VLGYVVPLHLVRYRGSIAEAERAALLGEPLPTGAPATAFRRNGFIFFIKFLWRKIRLIACSRAHFDIPLNTAAFITFARVC